ncbi:MAG: hypothetical protein K5877_10405 [Lachnospiraceae bacterium]|nr:hypothetical protein [Lachnospiraceae bacterium]
MKWKSDVRISRENGILLELNGMTKKVETDDEFIAKLMESGVSDEDLVKKVSLELDGDEISAGLRLGQFVEDYGDFIAELQRSRVFGE